MKKLLKPLVKQAVPYTPVYEKQFLSSVPLKPWIKNLLAAFLGTTSGLWIGQYFPDVYFVQIKDDLPEIQFLKQNAQNLPSNKLKQQYPRSIFDYPKNPLFEALSKPSTVKQGSYMMYNDITKKQERYTVHKIDNADRSNDTH